MSNFDDHSNFAIGTVQTAPSPAASGTSLFVTSDFATNDLPSAPFNAYAFPNGVRPLRSNAEIFRVTAVDTGTGELTIDRAEEGTTAQSIAVGWWIVAGITAKTMTDIEDAVDALEVLMTTAEGRLDDIESSSPENLLDNGAFINNSTNGYGGTPDDWTNSSANPFQGGFPTFTKQQLIDITGVADGDIEGLWNLNGNFNDLSTNGYNLTASGSPTDTSDSLMAQAKAFASASSQYASATAANTLLAGNQTWHVNVRFATLPGTVMRIFGHSDSTPTVYGNIFLTTDSKFSFQLTGLTTNTTVTSPVVAETGKWYSVTAVYDSSNSQLSIYVNGIKTTVTASGNHTTSGTQTVAVGRMGSRAAEYLNGSLQNAIMLSVALTQDQAKKLHAATLYQKIKLRRASSTDGYIYQRLRMADVTMLRGKTVTFSIEAYQSSSSTAEISINDGSDQASTASTTTGAWVTLTATKTIDAAAQLVELRIKIKTTDSTNWYRNARLNLGSVPYNYQHSESDWDRFPRLLRMDMPEVVRGYTFEEGREFTWTPVKATTSGTLTSITNTKAVFQFNKKLATLNYHIDFNYNASGANGGGFSIPIGTSAGGTAVASGVRMNDGSVRGATAYIDAAAGTTVHERYDAATYANATVVVRGTLTYPIA